MRRICMLARTGPRDRLAADLDAGGRDGGLRAGGSAAAGRSAAALRGWARWAPGRTDRAVHWRRPRAGSPRCARRATRIDGRRLGLLPRRGGPARRREAGAAVPEMNRLTRASMLGDASRPVGFGASACAGCVRALAGPRGAALPGRGLGGSAVGSRCGGGRSPGQPSRSRCPGFRPARAVPARSVQLTASSSLVPATLRCVGFSVGVGRLVRALLFLGVTCNG